MFLDTKILEIFFFFFWHKYHLALVNTSEFSKSTVDDLKLHCALAASSGKTRYKDYLYSEREAILLSHYSTNYPRGLVLERM